MYNNIDDTFSADEVEDFKLKGNYRIKTFYNNHPDLESLEQVPSYHCKAVFFQGNVLYKEDEPKIMDYIELMKKFTYTEPDKKIERNRVQRVGGTICPTSEDIYEIDDKVFTLYGRYIYGYDDFDKVTLTSKTSKNKIYIKRVEVEEEHKNLSSFLYEHSFAFKIVDRTTQVLYAFGLYR